MEKHPLSFMTFWSINHTLDRNKLKAQLREFKRLGFNGVIFHPRNYPGVPEYLSQAYYEILSDVILCAKQLGMEFWLYDENGFPSGSASGKVLQQMPDLRGQWVEYHGGNLQFCEKKTVNTLEKSGCDLFISLTFDGYKNGLSPEAFQYVTGFFSDEVGFVEGDSIAMKNDGVPYNQALEEKYQKNFGQSLRENLIYLFEDRGDYKNIRRRYWETVTDLLGENFYEPINCWCRENGKLYTAHAKGEESPYFQVSYSGSVYQIMKNVNVPAVDALERYPGNHYYPCIAKSIADQLHSGECLCEAIGGSGWGLKPGDFVRYVKWLMDCGINRFTFHLSQYELKAQAIRDWPPSIPLAVNWKEAFPTVLQQLREYYENTILPRQQQEKVLIVCPTRAVMERFVPQEIHVINEHNGAGVPDTPCGKISNEFLKMVEKVYSAGMAFHVTEERIAEEFGIPEENGIRIGNCSYRKVIMGEDCSFSKPEIENCLKKLRIPVPQAKPAEPKRLAAGLPVEIKRLQLKLPEENQLFLEFSDGGEAEISVCGRLSGETKICFSDLCQEVRFNGKCLTAEPGAPQTYPVPEGLWQEKNRITIVPLDEKQPFAYLRGNFLVKSRSPYDAAKNHQLYTVGPFYLESGEKPADPETMIQSGYPFCRKPVSFAAEIVLPRQASALRFEGTEGDALLVSLDGGKARWLIQEPFSLKTEELTAGKHRMDVSVYPSTFNTYGPHHHIDGNRHVTSPDQFSGKKNFADFKESPSYTLVEGWHFVPFGIPGNIIMEE